MSIINAFCRKSLFLSCVLFYICINKNLFIMKTKIILFWLRANFNQLFIIWFLGFILFNLIRAVLC